MVNISERVFKVDGLLKAVNETLWFTLLLTADCSRSEVQIDFIMGVLRELQKINYATPRLLTVDR